MPALRPWMALLFVSALAPRTADAQVAMLDGLSSVDEPLPPSTEDEGEDRLEEPSYGVCGTYLRTEGITITDEGRDRHFRGIGAPGHGTEAELAIDGGDRDLTGPRSGAALRLGMRTVYGHILGSHFCLVGDIAFGMPLGWLGSSTSYQTGHLLLGTGVLFRSQYDRLRLQLGVDAAFPSLGSTELVELGMQSLYSAGLLSGPDDDLLWTPGLEWGGRGRLEIDVRGDPPDTPNFSVWLALKATLGIARAGSVIGPREGLVSGLRVDILFGSARVDGNTSFGLRAGFRARVGLGSLWPTDILVPMQLSLPVQLGYAPTSDLSFTAEAHASFLQPSVRELGSGHWVIGLKLTLAVSAAPAPSGPVDVTLFEN